MKQYQTGSEDIIGHEVVIFEDVLLPSTPEQPLLVVKPLCDKPRNIVKLVSSKLT